MISFNENDYYMPEISKYTKLFNTITQCSYRIHGLKMQHHYHVLIRGNYDIVFGYYQAIEALKSLFLRNGIVLQAQENNKLKSPFVYIGLRKDVRKYPKFSASLLQTMIYTFEGKISFREKENPNYSKYNFPNKPKL